MRKRFGKTTLGDEDETHQIPPFVLPILRCTQNVKYSKVADRCRAFLFSLMFTYL